MSVIQVIHCCKQYFKKSANQEFHMDNQGLEENN